MEIEVIVNLAGGKRIAACGRVAGVSCTQAAEVLWRALSGHEEVRSLTVEEKRAGAAGDHGRTIFHGIDETLA